MKKILDAARPGLNAAVAASAGTGKTWLLVTRLLRLLLAGARPDGILAVTFTRKAAAEMHSRLLERLQVMASCSESDLLQELNRIDVTPSPKTLSTCRRLHEQLLRSGRTPRTTTFHAFCQDLLKRFPIEADITPGFELVESTRSIESEALQAIYADATLNPDSPLAAALESLYSRFGHTTAESIVRSFLTYRSEWWAFTFGRENSTQYACDLLRSQLEIGNDGVPYDDFLVRHGSALLEFSELLTRHPTKTNLEDAEDLRNTLTSEHSAEIKIQRVTPAFLTKENKPRARKQSKAQAGNMGPAAEERLLDLHESLSSKLLALQDIERAHDTFELSRSWFTAGTFLINAYQRIKEERRLLDFADLEWRTYVLLAENDYSAWVQYKLDQRINHLLIDEFQDTNPIQWQMILPLLNELASGDPENARSIFLVGDEKQSIYQFRRADPRLFQVAREWLKDQLQAQTHTLNSSRRSAHAVVDVVNAVFQQSALRDVVRDFPIHETHLGTLWGHVEILPLAQPDSQNDTPTPVHVGLRNPLRQPRIARPTTIHDIEATVVAGKIQELIAKGTVIATTGGNRPLRYSDILLLVRNRTNVSAFENALRNAHIPYDGAARGTLLQSREITDLVTLLEVLTTPFNNLALATILRSPVFNCSDEHLSMLALHNDQGTWAQRLAELAPELPKTNPLHRANEWISRWTSAAGMLPVHDLLDRIYSEGQVVDRYLAAAPAHLHASIGRNLEQFIDLALELDSGRYPSLGRFISSVRAAQQGLTDGPDADSAASAGDGVRVMTIHAAKGLESPVVFLVDAASSSQKSDSTNVYLVWEPAEKRPRNFFISRSKNGLDPLARSLAAKIDSRHEQEDLNLLYVAMTRAKQMLFISGSSTKPPGDRSWYQLVCRGMAELPGQDDRRSYSSGTLPMQTAISDLPPTSSPEFSLDPMLTRPVPASTTLGEIKPSRTDGSNGESRPDEVDIAGTERGVAIHRLLELLSVNKAVSVETLRRAIESALHRDIDPTELITWKEEALNVLSAPHLQDYFDTQRFIRARNEAPLSYIDNYSIVHGVVDRIVEREDEVVVIDYKTHRVTSESVAKAISSQFASQLGWYTNAAKLLWPHKAIRTCLVFTALPVAVDISPSLKS